MSNTKTGQYVKYLYEALFSVLKETVQQVNTKRSNYRNLEEIAIPSICRDWGKSKV